VSEETTNAITAWCVPLLLPTYVSVALMPYSRTLPIQHAILCEEQKDDRRGYGLPSMCFDPASK
jgi:hypothetical protein